MTFTPRPQETGTPTHNPNSKGPYTLLTVNTTPERAFRLISRVTSILATEPQSRSTNTTSNKTTSNTTNPEKSTYTITHLGNCSSPSSVAATVRELQPDIVFAASMWTAEEVGEIEGEARREKGDVLFHAIPQGLQVERGPDAIVEYLVEVVPGVLDGEGK